MVRALIWFTSVCMVFALPWELTVRAAAVMGAWPVALPLFWVVVMTPLYTGFVHWKWMHDAIHEYWVHRGHDERSHRWNNDLIAMFGMVGVYCAMVFVIATAFDGKGTP